MSRSDSRYSLASILNQPSTTRYDDQNGQVYRETIVSARNFDSRWAFRSFADNRKDGSRRRQNREPGAPSLRRTAIATLALNTDRLTVDALRRVPLDFAKEIWNCIRDMDVDSLHAWTTFVKAFPDEQGPSVVPIGERPKPKTSIFGYHYNRVTLPDRPLCEYFSYIEAPRLEFVTHLTISHVNFSRAEMVQLAKLKNLSTLNICSPRTYSLGAPSQGIIDDGIIRAWSRCAADEGAFPLLRVLKLRHQRELTPRCIDYLNAFPVLNIFCVSEFSPAMPQKTKRKADKWGWKCLTEDDLGLFYPKPTDSIHNRPQYEDEYLPRTPCPVYVPSRQPCNALEILLFNPGAARAAFEMLRQCCCPDCPSSLNTYSEDPNLRTAPPTLSILFGTDEAFHPWLWGFLCFYRHNKHSEDSARSLKRKAGKDLASGSSGTAGAELDATGISRPSADGVPPQKGRKMRNLKGHSNESLLKLFQG